MQLSLLWERDGMSNMRKHLRSCKEYKVWEAANPKKGSTETQTVLTLDGAGGNVRLGKVSQYDFREAWNEMLVLG